MRTDIDTRESIVSTRNDLLRSYFISHLKDDKTATSPSGKLYHLRQKHINRSHDMWMEILKARYLHKHEQWEVSISIGGDWKEFGSIFLYVIRCHTLVFGVRMVAI